MKKNKPTHTLNNEINTVVEKAKAKQLLEISLELHDNVNQILSVSLISLEMLRRKTKELNEEWYKMTHYQISLAIKEIRNISQEMVSTENHKLPFLQNLNKLCNTYSLSSTLLFSLHVDDDFSLLQQSLYFKKNLFRIFQESINNISKHSKATQVTINLNVKDNFLIVQIADNGIGINHKINSNGIGLENIKKRVSFFSGKLLIKNNSPTGLVIKILFPIATLK